MSLRFAQMYTLPNTSEYLRTLTWRFPTFTKSIAKNSRVLAMPSIWYLQNHPLKMYISYGFQSFVHTFCCYLWTTTKSPKQISTENPFNPRKNIHPPKKKKKKSSPQKRRGALLPFARRFASFPTLHQTVPKLPTTVKNDPWRWSWSRRKKHPEMSRMIYPGISRESWDLFRDFMVSFPVLFPWL